MLGTCMRDKSLACRSLHFNFPISAFLVALACIDYWDEPSMLWGKITAGTLFGLWGETCQYVMLFKESPLVCILLPICQSHISSVPAVARK